MLCIDPDICMLALLDAYEVLELGFGVGKAELVMLAMEREPVESADVELDAAPPIPNKT